VLKPSSCQLLPDLAPRTQTCPLWLVSQPCAGVPHLPRSMCPFRYLSTCSGTQAAVSCILDDKCAGTLSRLVPAWQAGPCPNALLLLLRGEAEAATSATPPC
jgi:hypothetical protein